MIGMFVCFAACGTGANVLKTKDLSKMTKPRNEIAITDRWNVEALYANENIWKEELERLQKSGWSEMEAYKGKLSNPQLAIAFLDLYLGISRKLEKLHVYAHLRMDEDLGNDQFKSAFGLVSSLAHEFQHASAWIEPELLSLSETDFKKLLSHPGLELYQFYLERVGRMRPHTLSEEMEELLALAAKPLQTASHSFSALNNADMIFPAALDKTGKEHPLTHASYQTYLRSPDRALRKSAFQNLHKTFDAHSNTLCELLQGQVQSHLFQSKARKFSSCVESALFPHQVDTSVYENLIQSVRRNLPLMHRYIALRKKWLQIADLHVYDLAVPLVSNVEIQMPYHEACQAVIASVQPLGKEYQQALQQGLLQDRWVDVYENERKRSGAYSSGCYDSMPYILMNYQGNLNDIFTLAHEAGHSMHSLLSHRHQPYVYASYPIFVAEVASTFNEQLLLHYLQSEIQGKKERAYLINHQIEGIRNTIFRQTLFAEFELLIHRLAEEGVPLTPTLLKEKYVQLYRDYYGPELVIDPELAIEWARIPHFYYNFYVYQYATGLSAALALHEKVTTHPAAAQDYLAFLSSGGSHYPIDLLKRAGVDMRSSDPVDAAMRRFDQLIRELEEALQ